MALEIVKVTSQSWDSRTCAADGVGLDAKEVPNLSLAVLTSYPTCTTVSMASESSSESLKLKHW